MINADTVSGRKTTTNFSYRVAQNPGGHSTGILYSRPTYIQILRNDAFGKVWGGQAELFSGRLRILRCEYATGVV